MCKMEIRFCVKMIPYGHEIKVVSQNGFIYCGVLRCRVEIFQVGNIRELAGFNFLARL